MEGIASRLSAIKRNEIHGAAFLTEEALNILGNAASRCPGDSGWEPCLSEVAITLASAKPSMAGLRNATGRLFDRLSELGPLEGSRLAEMLAKEMAADLRKAAVVRTCRGAPCGSRPQAAGAALEDAQLALIGADAVTPGLLINGTPSQSLAQAAAGRVPFYAVCETVQFTRDARDD